MQRLVTAFLFSLCLVASGQPKQTYPDNYFIDITVNGKSVQFRVGQGRVLVDQMHAKLNPDLPENSYMPPLMKEKLRWMKEGRIANTSGFPQAWTNDKQGISLSIIASANYCLSPDLGPDFAPCIFVYSPVLMFFMKSQFPMMPVPNEIFKDTFGVMLTHEGVHHERDRAFFEKNKTDKEVLEEERRTWVKTLKEAVSPLRKAGRHLYAPMERLDDSLSACSYKLPCPGFESMLSLWVNTK